MGNQHIDVLDIDLPILATDAAMELDALAFTVLRPGANPPSRTAITKFANALEASFSATGQPPSRMISFGTSMALEQAYEAANAESILGQEVNTPATFLPAIAVVLRQVDENTQHRTLRALKYFCIAVAKNALSYQVGASEYEPEQPFRQ
jgi:hypothetical protein